MAYFCSPMVDYSQMIKTFGRSAIILFAFLLAFQSMAIDFCISADDTAQAVAQTTDDGEKSNHDFDLQEAEAIVPLVQAQLSQSLFLIYELNLIKEANFEIIFDQDRPTDAFFQTLFRLIIGPNAP